MVTSRGMMNLRLIAVLGKGADRLKRRCPTSCPSRSWDPTAPTMCSPAPSNLLIARGAYREAARMYPEDLIELRQGARIIEKSK
jgi:hypothetical protein